MGVGSRIGGMGGRWWVKRYGNWVDGGCGLGRRGISERVCVRLQGRWGV